MADVRRLQEWISLCKSSVLSAPACEHTLDMLEDSDIEARLEVMRVLIEEMHGKIMPFQAIALTKYNEAVRALKSYLEELHAKHQEDEQRWFGFLKKAPQIIHRFDVLLRCVDKREKFLLDVLAVAVRDTEEGTSEPVNNALSDQNVNAEDLPIESQYIKLQKQYIAEMAKKEALKEKQKRRMTLATMPSSSSKKPRIVEDSQRTKINSN
ncbi:hypothetical protein THRCLA_21192 [Thraustotheca clavata]|uniref:Uncharacterized protein n=1 Tax=Thraustotheca clavata TaxID=74557 RepID=A0A1V9ZZ53_9STRA|nr:hypothetical protein THRCLA_21192 [Thraustotheca clavata]